MSFSIDLFDYQLPPELIAQNPAEKRDESRLLLCKNSGRLGEFAGELSLSHARFRDIANELNGNDLVIFNNAKVLPVRLLGRRLLADGTQGGDAEMVLLHPLSADLKEWSAIMKISARASTELRVLFEPGLIAQCLSTHEERLAQEGEVRVRLSGLTVDRIGVEAWLMRYGHVPLPPYIERADEAKDREIYQTVYAEKVGSAAAPTAGFHFSAELMQGLKASGVEFEFLTLHVGIGTFRPVKAKTLDEHKMHVETFEVGDALAAKIRKAKSEGRRIVAVGTTVVRALESWWKLTAGELGGGMYKTDLFIQPGFQFRVVDDLVTNFHLPKSTLLVLVSAGMGVENAKLVYRTAVENRYRFFSYGDAMFIRGKSI